MDVTARLYGRTTDYAAGRRACLDAVVRDAAASAERLVIVDRHVLFDAARRYRCTDSLIYELLAPYADPMLWVPNAVAWYWNRGGTWRDSVAGFCTQHDL